MSIGLHVLLAGVAVGAWWFTRTPSPPQTLAIEATVVDAKVLRAATQAPQPKPKPPEPQPQPVEPQPQPPPEPEPKPDVEAERRKAEAERQQRETQEREQAERAAEAERVKKLEAERAAAERERVAVEQKKAAEAKKAADAKKAAEEKRAADEARIRAQREAELRKSLEAEERADAMRASGEADRWKAQIRARIERAWIRPPSARPGVSCDVAVTQVPGGEIVSVRVEQCTGGDEAMRSSVEAAVYRASPLPPPPDPALFERNLQLTFRPNE
jgi:colicin import membrane protein